MADNFGILAPTSPSHTIAADDIGGVLYPRQKLAFGPDGTNEGDVATSNGLPVGPARSGAYEPLIVKAFGTITTSYANLSLTNIATVRELIVTNNTDGIMYLSFDAGTTNHAVILPGAIRSIAVPAGTTAVWAKWIVAATAGNAYFEVVR